MKKIIGIVLLIAALAVLTAGRAHLRERLGLTGQGGGDHLAGVPPTFLPRNRC